LRFFLIVLATLFTIPGGAEVTIVSGVSSGALSAANRHNNINP
jgi:hypothetical protein